MEKKLGYNILPFLGRTSLLLNIPISKFFLNMLLKIHRLLGRLDETYYLFCYWLASLWVNYPPLSPTDKLVVITVAFNNPESIQEQLKSIRQNLLDDFLYVIADNSNNSQMRRRFQTIARKERSIYLGVPVIFGPRINVSFRYSQAVNWVFEQFVKRNQIEKFGFLDGDVFLCRKFSLIAKLKKLPFYGQVYSKGRAWFLLPCFCFFNLSAISLYRFDFLPAPGFDSGGRNWKSIFSKFNRDLIKKEMPRTNRVKKNFINNKYISSRLYWRSQEFGGWVHLRSQSGWIANGGWNRDNTKS